MMLRERPRDCRRGKLSNFLFFFQRGKHGSQILAFEIHPFQHFYPFIFRHVRRVEDEGAR